MDRVKLTKEKLNEILAKLENEEDMENYYKLALNDGFVASNHLSAFALLIALIIHKRKSAFRNMEETILLGLELFHEQSECWKYGELLDKANLEIVHCLLHDEKIPDKQLVEFCETYAFYLFYIGDYLKCLNMCNNALYRDKNSSFCNFFKAAIIELCYINKTYPSYQKALLNYQKKLLDRCDVSKLPVSLEHYNIMRDILDERMRMMGEKDRKITFTIAESDYKKTIKMFPGWMEEYDFYLRKNLLLNPLTNFDKFIEATTEEFNDLQIDDEYKKYFEEIIEDFKLCRKIAFSYYKDKNKVGKREMSMAYSYAYSIFDKIAYLITKVCDLDNENDMIYFTKGGLFNRKTKNTNFTFKEIKNINIIPLYRLMKQVRVPNNIKNALQTGTFEHRELRNTIEHKSIYLVKDSKLKTNTDFLLNSVRDAILYTYMFLQTATVENFYEKTTLPKTLYFDALLKSSNVSVIKIEEK